MNNNEDSYCRLCAVRKPHHTLVDLQTDQTKLERIVNKLTLLNCQLDFHENIMPKTVCHTCINSLTRAFDFLIAIERAQVVLKDIFLSQTIKKEEDTSDCETFVYEMLEEKFGDDIEIKSECNVENNIDIKFKLNKEDNSQKLKPLNELLNSTKYESKTSLSDLDSIPLSHLKLSWQNYSWTCAYCETQFPNISELQSHSMKYHKTCNAYRCTDCKVKKLRLDRFLTHIRSHRKHLRLSCYKCLKIFPSTHEANKHSAAHIISDFKCNGCNTCYPSLDELKKHSSLFYKDSRSRNIPIQAQNNTLQCTICQKKYKTKTSLHTHLLIHTDRRRDHTCEVCGKCFLQKHSLAEHMIQHDDKRPFNCEICKLSFRTKNHLRKHVGVHGSEKPFSCEQCGKCFRLQKQLNSHGIIHTDSLPHVCSYCNKGFRFRSILNQHIRQHTGVKPYTCKICGRDFTNWPNYNKHMKRRHNMNMAKKKHTPDGLYPIDPTTGKVIYPDMDKVLEWKNKILEQLKPGRPKLKECTEKHKIEETNNN